MKYFINLITKPSLLRNSLILCCFLLLLLTGCSPRAQNAPTVAIHPGFVTQQELTTILASGSGKPKITEGRAVSAVLPHHCAPGMGAV